MALYVHTHLPEKRKVMLTALYIHHDFADRENGNSKGDVSMQNGNDQDNSLPWPYFLHWNITCDAFY